jgi:hypothetical protein
MLRISSPGGIRAQPELRMDVMAQRGAWTPDKVRQRIKVSMLMNRLQKGALGQLKDREGNFIELPDSQRRAIEILLNKTLPNLSSIDATHKGDSAHPLVISSSDGAL